MGEANRYVLKLDEDGNQCLYDEREERKLVCGSIYAILNYVRAKGNAIIFVKSPINIVTPPQVIK